MDRLTRWRGHVEPYLYDRDVIFGGDGQFFTVVLAMHLRDKVEVSLLPGVLEIGNSFGTERTFVAADDLPAPWEVVGSTAVDSINVPRSIGYAGATIELVDSNSIVTGDLMISVDGHVGSVDIENDLLHLRGYRPASWKSVLSVLSAEGSRPARLVYKASTTA